MTSKQKRSLCAGYTLMEMLGYIAIFSVILVLSSQLFLSSSRLSTFSLGAMDRVHEIRNLDRAFRDAVRNAVSVEPGVGEWKTDEDTLVLKSSVPSEYLVLGMLDGRQQLNIMEVREKEGGFTAEKYVTCGLPLSGVRFEVADGGHGASLEITTLPVNPDKPQSSIKRRFTAALRMTADGE